MGADIDPLEATDDRPGDGPGDDPGDDLPPPDLKLGGGGSAPEPVIDDLLAEDEQEVSIDVLVRELEELLTERDKCRYRLVHIPMEKDEHGRWLDQYGSRFNKGPPPRPPYIPAEDRSKLAAHQRREIMDGFRMEVKAYEALKGAHQCVGKDP